MREEAEGGAANTISITSLNMARQAEEADTAARARLVLLPTSGALPSMHQYMTVFEEFLEYMRNVCEVLACADMAKGRLETPPRVGAPSHYNALVGNIAALKRFWGASHLYGSNDTILWRNMYVLSQYALGNDPTPDAKRMMQTLNLALPDTRGVLYSMSPSIAVSAGTGAAGTAGSGGKTQKFSKDVNKAYTKVKTGERLPERSFLLGGLGTPCTGPCHECGENTHHVVECPHAFLPGVGNPDAWFLSAAGTRYQATV
jgi:hypothetical protein